MKVIDRIPQRWRPIMESVPANQETWAAVRP